jgi:uncharacterized GH25 family protein
MKKYLLSFLLVLGLSLSLAHEYVLIAHDFILKPGDTLALHLFVADGFNVEIERPVQKEMTRRFELLSEKGRTDLLAEAQEGALPLLTREVDFNGLGLVHLERDYARITMDNEKFRAYLRTDNIENIRIDDSTQSSQSERYARYIKALIQSTPIPGDSLHKLRVGQTFEIILLDNPYQLEQGDWLRAQVFFRGAPLVDKVITARNRLGSQPAIHQYARTDSQGICSFKLERAGEWFVHATHMISCPDPDDSDWESFWASYSFGME